METVERQLTKLRSGIGRLIDSDAEGVISKAEFEPRLAGMRQRVTKLEAEAVALQDTARQTRSLQLVIGKLETFAALIQDWLDGAVKRDIIHTLVRRIKIGGQHVRVVFRVDPGPQDGADARGVGQRRSRHDRGLENRTPNHARRAAALFGPRQSQRC